MENNDDSSLDIYYKHVHEFPEKNANNYLDHICLLKVDSDPYSVRQTSITCTIGPACREVPKLIEMIKNGMNIARLNFSHGTHEYHAGSIKNIREAFDNLKEQGFYRPVAIALDTKGPEIRTGLVKGSFTAEVELIKGNHVNIVIDKAYANSCDENNIYINYPNIINIVKLGSRIFIDDALISLVVKAVNKENGVIETEIENGGTLCSQKCVNLPCLKIDLPSVSAKDKEDLEFGVKQNVDIILASFIRNADGVKQVRKALGPNGKHILVIAKIEDLQGVKNFDEILKESDGIMISRGDLGVEIPIQKVFIAQKMMISKCNLQGKPAICATQMLESMTRNPRPTRAEVSDVANAFLDGADCVMLSGETAKGNYPIESLRMMHAIAIEAESAIYHKELFESIRFLSSSICENSNSIAIAAVEASFQSQASAIIVLTSSGYSAHLVAKYRPRCPIIGVTRNPTVARQMHLWRGLFPLLIEDKKSVDSLTGEQFLKDVEHRVKIALDFARSVGFSKRDDSIIVINGWRSGSGNTNTLRIVQCP